MKKLCLILAFAMLLGLMVPVAYADVSTDLYTSAAEGTLIYTADFSGTDGYFSADKVLNDNISTTEDGEEYRVGWNWMNSHITAVVDPADPGKVTITVGTVEGSKKNTAWGCLISALPLNTETSYTLKFTVTRTDNTPIGLLFDGHHGMYAYTNKARLQLNGNALSGHSYTNYSDLLETVPDVSPDESDPSVQEYAITVSGATESYSVYVKADSGRWLFLDSSATGTGFSNESLGLYFYSYFETTATVSDVKVYKGASVVDSENAPLPPPEHNEETEAGEDNPTTEGTTAKEDTTTKAGPKVVVDDEETETSAPASESKKGCGSLIGFGGALFVMASAAGTAVFTFRRKRED